MNFTDSPYERLMKELPRPSLKDEVFRPRRPSSCQACSEWDGRVCIGSCGYDPAVSKKAAPSGQLGPK